MAFGDVLRDQPRPASGRIARAAAGSTKANAAAALEAHIGGRGQHLAEATANAIDDIRRQVATMKEVTTATVDSVGGIGASIEELRTIALAVVEAMQQRAAAASLVVAGQLAGEATTAGGRVAAVVTCANDVDRAAAELCRASAGIAAETAPCSASSTRRWTASSTPEALVLQWPVLRSPSAAAAARRVPTPHGARARAPFRPRPG
jgi:uncharacterized protein YoxC